MPGLIRSSPRMAEPPPPRTRLRLAFMGSAAFSVPTLSALVTAGHELAAVYSRPPKPAGRGQRPRPTPVQAFAEANGLPVMTPVTLKTEEAQAAFAGLGLDAAIVAAYGLLLPSPVLEAPRLGCLNVHASLLPRWRGAAPIERAILAGDTETGVTIMRVDEGLDTGPMLLSDRLPIGERTTATELHDALAAMGARLMVVALDGVAAGTLFAHPQPDEGTTYAQKLERSQGRLDWNRPAVELDRMVRAFTPDPGAWFEYAGERLKVLRAAVIDTGSAADSVPWMSGTVVDDRLTVACGADHLRLETIQRPGRAAMPADAFLRGYPLPAGTRLG
ncbi:MAG: methionyl-tRNA formyltransferase [Rhodospirillales bacterium]